jgi:hypothetical protein
MPKNEFWLQYIIHLIIPLNEGSTAVTFLDNAAVKLTGDCSLLIGPTGLPQHSKRSRDE